MLETPRSDYPLVHVFDEPQFSTQDGYIGFMLNFFQHLRSTGAWCFLPASVRAIPRRHHAQELRALSVRLQGAGGRVAELRRTSSITLECATTSGALARLDEINA